MSINRCVAPHVGAWIEISVKESISAEKEVAPHVGAWIEIKMQLLVWRLQMMVAPHVGAWIEIL